MLYIKYIIKYIIICIIFVFFWVIPSILWNNRNVEHFSIFAGRLPPILAGYFPVKKLSSYCALANGIFLTMTAATSTTSTTTTTTKISHTKYCCCQVEWALGCGSWGREVAGWEVIAKWSELASSGGWTAGRLATFISIDTCSSRDSSRDSDSDSSRICLHLAISALSLSLLPLSTLPLTSWGDNAAFLTHKNVENQAEIMRTNWATKVVPRRRRRSRRRRWWLELAVEVSELGLMNMKILGEKIAATVWRSQRQRQVPHPPSEVCVCSVWGRERGNCKPRHGLRQL